MAIAALALLVFSLLPLLSLVRGTMVFSDNFLSGSFTDWSEAYISVGSSQTVSNGIARFIVPTPPSGTQAYSYLHRGGFTSTVNSIITASQDVYVTKVPSGCVQGNGAIFFLYVCDSTDLGGNNGNFGVGIDGSGVWSLWIGGNSIYSYIFQTTGSPPQSNTWYHVVLMIDNSAGTVVVSVNDALVISSGQQQFTDKTHPISLMSGMGEDWWSIGSGQQEVDVDNVQLEISDASSMPTPISTLPSQSQTLTTPMPTPRVTTKPSPQPTPEPSPQPAPVPSSTHKTLQATTQDGSNVTLTVRGNITNAELSTVSINADVGAVQTIVSFSVTGEIGTAGFGNLTIPKSTVPYGTFPKVYLDGRLTPSQGYSQDADNYYVWWTLHFSKHTVSIVFGASDSSMREIPLWLILPVVIAAVIGATAAFMFRKR